MSKLNGGWPRWWYTVLLCVVYVGLFHFWLAVQDKQLALISGCIVVALMAAPIIRIVRTGYFASRVDIYGHVLILMDILLEAILKPVPANLGFYWCAVGFAVVLGSYRWYRLRLQRADAAADHLLAATGDEA